MLPSIANEAVEHDELTTTSTLASGRICSSATTSSRHAALACLDLLLSVVQHTRASYYGDAFAMISFDLNSVGHFS
jgi:hypothetical protein